MSGVSANFRASFAIWSSFVEMGLEPGVSSIVPSFRSVSRCRPLLRWVPGSVPPLRRSYCGTPTSRRTTRSLALTASFRRYRHGANGISQSFSVSLPCVPWSYAPADPPAQGLRGRQPLRFAPSASPSEHPDSSASATSPISEPSPRPTCSLSTLRRAGCPVATQDSLPADGLVLAGRDSNPLGRATWFRHVVGFTWLPPGRDLLGARGARGDAAIPST